MKTQSLPQNTAPGLDLIIAATKRLPTIAVFGESGKNETVSLLCAAFEKQNLNIKLVDLSTISAVSQCVYEESPADLLLINCPSYTISEDQFSLAVCSKIMFIAGVKLLVIGDEADDLPLIFNLLMMALPKAFCEQCFHYVRAKTEKTDPSSVLTGEMVEENLSALQDVNPKAKADFVELGEVVLPPAESLLSTAGACENPLCSAA